MIDGTVARKTNTASEFGSKLDTIADFIFLAVCLIKLLPILTIPVWIYVWISIIALIKIINVVSGYVIQKKFIAVHTVMNKVTGALLFLLPMTLLIIELKYSAPVVCIAATFAAIQEGHDIRNRSNMICESNYVKKRKNHFIVICLLIFNLSALLGIAIWYYFACGLFLEKMS